MSKDDFYAILERLPGEEKVTRNIRLFSFFTLHISFPLWYSWANSDRRKNRLHFPKAVQQITGKQPRKVVVKSTQTATFVFIVFIWQKTEKAEIFAK